MNEELQYKVFEWLRFPLIVGVVFIHCYGKPVDYDTINFGNLSAMDMYDLFRVCISQVLTHICVPTYYFISGFLFFCGLEEWNVKNYICKLKRRVWSLLIPYCLWNTIRLLVSLQSELRHKGLSGFYEFLSDNNYWHLYWDCNQWNLDRLDWLGGVDYASSPFLYPLWFLRDLMVCSLCYPLFYLLLKKIKIWGMFFLSICYISGVFIHFPGFSIMAFFFFGLGGYMKMYNIDLNNSVYRFRRLIYAISIVLLITATFLNGHNTPVGNIVYPFWIIFGFFSLINIASFVVKKEILKQPPLLSRSAFFIYLSHTVIVLKSCSVLTRLIFGEHNPLLLTLSYLMTPFLIIITCLFLYYVMNKYTPRLCHFLTGNR